jgi:multidrug efflux system outer membrane protein
MRFADWSCSAAVVCSLLMSRDARAQAAPSPLPAPLAQDDAMLEPVPPAPHVVAGWDDALSVVRARSTDLRILVDEIERSNGLWREALAASLPTISASGSYSVNVLRGQETLCVSAAGPCATVAILNATSYGGSLTLTQPLLATRAWHAVKTATVVRQAAELTAEDEKRLLTLALANAVVSVVTGERMSEINRVGLRAALDRLALARRRVALGAGNALDTVRAEQDVAVARSALVSGDETLRRARDTLGLALGSTEPWGVLPDVSLNGLEGSVRATCGPTDGVEQRADLAAAERQTVVARRNVDDVWLQFAPTVDLVSTMSASSAIFANGLHEAWSITGVLTVPLFDGGVRYGALRDTRAQADEASQRWESARRNAVVQVEQARRGIDVAEESRRVAEQARDLAKETERLSRVAFQAGTGTSLDLIDSGRRLREAETQLALQEYGVVQARIGAFLALSRCRW